MKALLIPYTFVLMNWAPVAGLYYFLRRGRYGADLWIRLNSVYAGQRAATAHELAPRDSTSPDTAERERRRAA